MYTIDFVFLSILAYALKRWMRNPFDKFRREETRMQMVEKFIKKNNLEKIETQRVLSLGFIVVKVVN